MADSNAVPVDRVRIFKRNGTPVAEFRASVDRSWVIGGEGRAEFSYPIRKANVVNADVIQFGNWLLVENDSLPAWVGVIDTPREWSARNVSVRAYTPEHVLGWRIGPPEEVVKGSAGEIFADLIARTNAAEQTILRAGSIWKGGSQREETINPTPLSDNLAQLWERSQEDYTWQPGFDDAGNLLVYGNWMQALGISSQAILQEAKQGGNIEEVDRLMVEDGPIVNSLLAYGEGETWESKPVVTVEDVTSISAFGLREEGKEYTGVTEQTTLQDSAAGHVNEFRYASRSFLVNALHVGDTFQALGMGNVLTLRFESAGFLSVTGGVGFEARVRIVGMRYDPDARNKVQLVLREVTGGRSIVVV